ncbi:MAG: hypothetical protein FJZ90_19360, partial [Chloroflexi bacterium]|nr:hypothetical protein [Chloroflexota bacterium]
GAEGYQPRGEVTGIVFEDTDGDGVQDPGEPGIGGVTVVITDSLGVTQTVTTDPTGHYTATVPPGSTTADVQEETISPCAQQTAGENPSTVNVIAGTSVFIGADGYQWTGGISDYGRVYGYVFADQNANKAKDAGEPPLAGVTVQLIGPDPSPAMVAATTSVTGFYQFICVLPGNYIVKEIDNPLWCDSTPDIVPVTVTLASNIRVDFAEAGHLMGQVIYQGRPAGNISWVDTVYISRCLPNSIVGCTAYTATTDVQGRFDSPCMPFGTWDFYVRDLHSLRRVAEDVTINTLTGTAIVNFCELIEGDVNADDFIDVSDLAIFGAGYGLNQGQPGWDPRCDLNNDKTVNVQDLALLGANYGKSGFFPILPCP